MKQTRADQKKIAEELKNRYKLREKSESYLRNLFIQWGIRFSKIEDEKDYAKIFEKEKEKPFLLIEYRGKKALVEFISQYDAIELVDKRFIGTFEMWRERANLPLLIVLLSFDDRDSLLEIRAAKLGTHTYTNSDKKDADGNQTIEFAQELPSLTKVNLLNLLEI